MAQPNALANLTLLFQVLFYCQRTNYGWIWKEKGKENILLDQCAVSCPLYGLEFLGFPLSFREIVFIQRQVLWTAWSKFSTWGFSSKRCQNTILRLWRVWWRGNSWSLWPSCLPRGLYFFLSLQSLPALQHTGCFYILEDHGTYKQVRIKIVGLKSFFTYRSL